LWIAWSTNQVLPDSSERLVGDEGGYDGLAYWLTQGYFFTWPGRVPGYPIFLAVCYLLFGHSYAAVLYVQAFVGVLTILLTFLLARRFTEEKSALLAAALVAVNPALILHVTHLYTEILYAPLLLLALLGLLRAIEQPKPHRFVFAGVLLAITNLCRPTAALFPALVPFLLPQAWPLTRRLFLSFVYTGAMVAVIAPWTYHNYRAFLPLSISGVVLWKGRAEFYHLTE
jgi:4-amino-4-deoxy-L-arabinose transferase-like glycosyltransferase